MKRSRIFPVVLAGAMALTSMAGALAQDATPAAQSPFAALGLPELTITASDSGLSVDQAEIPAGRYLVHLENASGNEMVSTGFVRLSEEITLEDLSLADEIAAGTPIPAEGPDPAQFAYLYETLIVPGASSLSPEVVVDLPAGEYGVWPDDPASEWVAPALTVTGDPEAEVTGPEPEAAVTIVEEGEAGASYSFRIEGAFMSGPQVVKVLNASDQPHFVEAWQYPEPITIDQIMNSMMFDPSSGATPTADMIDFSRVDFAGWAATQSAGTTQWVVMDLTAGQAVLACWIPDPAAGGVPHALAGMLQIFDVAE